MLPPLEPRILALTEELDSLTADSSKSECQDVILRALASLEGVIDDGSGSPVETVEAHWEAANLFAFRVEPREIAQSQSLRYLIAGGRKLRGYDSKQVSPAERSRVAWMWGSRLSQRADECPVDDRDAVIEVATDLFRLATSWSDGRDPRVRSQLENDYANHLLGSTPQANALNEISEATQLAEHASELAAESPPEDRAVILKTLGHCRRRQAGLVRDRDPDAARRLLEQALACYDDADVARSQSQVEVDCETDAGRSLALFELTELGDGADVLERSIDTARRSLRELDLHDSFRPELAMQLSESLLARYRLMGSLRDLEEAVELSEYANNPWPAVIDGDLRRRLQRRRLLVLNVTYSAFGDWRAEARALRSLSDELLNQGLVEDNADLEALRLLDDIERCVVQIEGDLDQVHNAERELDALGELIGRAEFHSGPLLWAVRRARAELALFQHVRYFADSQPSLGEIDRLRDAQIAIERTLQGGDARRVDIFSALHTQALLLAEVGFAERSVDTVQAALGALRRLTEAGRDDPAQSINWIDPARLGLRIAHFLGRAELEQTFLDILLRSANQLRAGEGAEDDLSWAARVRRSAAGDVASMQSNARDIAWLQVALDTGIDVESDSARTDFVRRAEEASAKVALVFLAQGEFAARASVCEDREWRVIELPSMRVDAVGRSAVNAYRAHQAAATSRSENPTWVTTRAALLREVEACLQGLATAISGKRPVALHLTGWAHLLPVVPVLSKVLGHAVPVAATLWRPPRDSSLVGLRPYGGIACPGPLDPLRLAVQDVWEGAAAYGSSGDDVLDSPTVEEALQLFRSSRVVLFAGHGEASTGDPGDACLLVRNGRVTARELLTNDLSNIDVALIAACEGLGPDRQIPESTCSPVTAMIRSGANAALGAHWRITESAASAFSRAFLSVHAQGAPVGEAYRVVLASDFAAGSSFSLYIADPTQIAPS